MVSLSFSTIRDAECPFRFNALYIAKTYKEPVSDAAIIGSMVAEVLANYREDCLNQNKRSNVKKLRSLASQKLSENSLSEEVRGQFLELIEKFEQSEFVNMPSDLEDDLIETKILLDHTLDLTEEESKKAFSLICDFAYSSGDTLYIIDDKTGRMDPDELQLDIYAYFMPRVFKSWFGSDISKVVGIFNMIASGRKIVKEYSEPPTYVIDLISQKISEVNSWTEFPAIACSRCQWCTVPGCPLREKAIVTLEPKEPVQFPFNEIGTHKDAARAIEWIIHAEMVVDWVKNRLIDYIAINGPVEAAGVIAELRPSSSWKASSTHAFIKHLISKGIPKEIIWEAISLTETTVKAILKKAKKTDLWEELEALGERKENKPRFGLYKSKRKEQEDLPF